MSLHWSAAGVPDRAAEWSLRAARKARQRNAFAEAWGYYQRALDVGAPVGGAAGLELVLEAAGTARLAGDPTAAAALLEDRAVASRRPAPNARAPWNGWAASSGRRG